MINEWQLRSSEGSESLAGSVVSKEFQTCFKPKSIIDGASISKAEPSGGLKLVWYWYETGLKPHLSRRKWSINQSWYIYIWNFSVCFSSIYSFTMYLENFWEKFQDCYQDGTSKKHLKTWSSTLDPNRCCVQPRTFLKKMYIQTYIQIHTVHILSIYFFPHWWQIFSPSRHVFLLFVHSKGKYMQPRGKTELHASIRTQTHTYIHKDLCAYIQT